jgi:hypothetical protein
MPSQLKLALATRKAAASLMSRSLGRGRSHAHRWLGAAVSTTTSKGVRVFSTTEPIIDEHESESFLTGTSSLYAEQMLELYEQDPNSVHASWKQYFDNLSQGVAYNEADFNQPTAVASSKAAAVSGVRSFFFLLLFLYSCDTVYYIALYGITLYYIIGYGMKVCGSASSHLTHPLYFVLHSFKCFPVLSIYLSIPSIYSYYY